MQSYLPSLTFANERIAWSLALITWYTEQLLNLVGGTDNIQQWVIDNLLASENDAENSGDALTHFIQCLEALESKDLVGSWNKREFIDANGRKWMAIFATNAWAEVNKAFSPCTYNKKSLKAHILRVGGIVDKTVKFDVSRDEVLDYRREMRRISIEIPGGETEKNLPKPPQQKTRRAWMIPIELYTGEDDGGSHNPTPPPDSPDSGNNLTQDEPPSPSSNNVTSHNDCPEPDSSNQTSSSNKLTENATEPDSKNVTSQNDCSESDSSTQSLSDNKLPENASLQSPKKVTSQNDHYEADSSTQSPSGNKLSQNDSEPSPQNMMSQSDYPEADSSTQSSSGNKLSQKLAEKSDNSDLTHPTNIDFLAYQNRVMECKKLMLACTNRSELTVFCSSAGFDYTEILWVWENLLTTDDLQKINQAVSNNPQNVSETEPLSQTGLHPSQKNVTPKVTDCDFCYLVTELAQSLEKNSPIANTFSNDETQVTEKEVTTEADANQESELVTPTENQCLTEVTEYNPDSEEEHQVSPQPIDWIELLEGIDQEMKRLNWSVEHGVDYLLHKYQKKSRQLLTDEEAIEFYEFLKNRKSKYVVGDLVIVTHAEPEFNNQVASVVEVLPNHILKVTFSGDRLAREVCGVYVRHYFPQTSLNPKSSIN